MNQPNQYDAVLGGGSPGPLPGGAILGITNRYSEPEHRQFCLDMAAAQLPVKHYDGRFYWSGPSVIVGDLQDVLGATRHSQHLLFREGKNATPQKAGRELLENYPFRIGFKGGNFKTYYSGGYFMTKYVH
jgi:hypothetical protein